MLFSCGVANACNAFQGTCHCLNQGGGLELQWSPATTFHLQRGESDCQGSGRCQLTWCRPTIFHSCGSGSCQHSDVVTRPLDSPGWITRWDIWSEFISADGDDSCLTDAIGTNEHGRTVYSAVIVPAGGSVEILERYQTARWMPTGYDEFLPHSIEMQIIKC